MARYKISDFLLPFTDKPIATPDDTVGQAFEYTQNSHSPIYVFDGKKYLGVVSAYQSLYHNFHAPYTKKVLSELMRTPSLSLKSSLFDVFRSMMDTRLYELPILDKNEKIVGVLKAKNILQTLARDEMISAYLVECVEIQPAVVHSHKGSVADIFHLLREKDTSRIILVDENERVSGIVTRSDIKTAFIRPNLRQRFRGKAEEEKQNIFDSEELYREDDPIARYAKTDVFTQPYDTSRRDILRTLIESEHNSVVLVDTLNRPTGMISLRDLVHCLAKFEPEIDTAIVFVKPDSVSEVTLQKAYTSIEQMIKKLSKITPIEKVQVTVKEQKYATKKVAEFETHILISMKGENVIASSSDKKYLDSLQSTIEIAEKQFIQHTKHTYHKAVAHSSL